MVNTNEFNITYFEACEFLGRSRKTISRYIRQGLIHPEEKLSSQGTLEYRFSLEDLKSFKMSKGTPAEMGHEEPRQDRPVLDEVKKEPVIGEPKPDETSNDPLVPFLMDQIKIKDGQIAVRDKQIDELIERDRESNILINGLQDKVLKIEGGKSGETSRDVTRQDESGKVMVL